MNRRNISAAVVAGALGLSVMAVSGVAQAAPDIRDIPTAKAEPKAKPDNRPDPLAQKRSALRQRAVDQLVAGKAKTVGKGANRIIRTSDGTEVDYPVTQSAQLLTFLVDFGDGTGNAAFPDNTAGPVHNEIAEPDASDNSTYWESDFSRQHYLDMFFNGLPDQNGESFHNVYKEMSSGRFDLQGDVSDWVSVAHPESYYQSATGDEDGVSMKNFIQDSANAWYDAQKVAGKSDAEIEAYLKSFDVWDRYDYDGDGNYNEPDGYIDHFQAIHAGEGEEAGASPWAIWSHRWAANPSAKVGPAGNQAGGVQIGNTGLWIRDYTTEPENGGLGVFAHEFGHDLGLPDYYDTQGGDNSTGFWNLMSSGSWMGHGDGTTGTTPDHMGATEKLFLGWYGTNDLAIVDGTGTPQQVVLGPSNHASTTGAQAVAVTLPKGQSTVNVVAPDGAGTHYFYSGNGDYRIATVTSPTVTVPAADPTLTARVSYSIEDDWDYAYAQVSTDGGSSWTNVETNRSTTTDPNQQNEGFGITGCSGVRNATSGACDNAWTDLTADLTAFAGQDVKLRFKMFNDAGYHELGFSVDSIKLGGTLVTDVEDGAPGWTLDGFRVMDGPSYTTTFDQYYLAENRQYRGYDKTLAEGPYSYDYSVSAPNKVDQFPYQDGLLVWYSNGLYSDNNTSAHPGGGEALPVDANGKYNLWTKGGAPYSYASGRLNTYDATFDVDQTDALNLTNESAGGINYNVASQPSVQVFDDSNVDAYWDGKYPRSGWYSTKVAGVGTMIQVLSSDEGTGRMVIKAGTRFVAKTGTASLTGTPTVGETLTAVAPTYYQKDAVADYQWKVAGQPVGTGSTYVVQPSDAGKEISVVITGSKPGYLDARDTLSVTGALRAAPVATSAPVVTGSPRVGQQLSVTPASWPVDGTSTYSWTAGDKVVGTGTSYTLKPADSGKTVTVTETRTAPGYQPGTATSEPTAKVLPAAVKLGAKLPSKVAKGKTAPVTVTVTSTGLTPIGKVLVTFGGKEVPAKALSGGTVTVRLPKLYTVGDHKVVVKYLPGAGFSRASKSFTIRVTK